MGLIVSYNACKALPVLGNLSHGALLSMACLIGAALADPLEPLARLAAHVAPALLCTGLWAAIYVQSNYEKDRAGDAAAGYRTSMIWLTIRQSAQLRGVAVCFVLAYVLFTHHSPWARVQFTLAAGLVLVSSWTVARDGTQAGALRGYRAAVHGGTLGMIGLGAGAVPLAVLVALTTCAHALTEWAFLRTKNP
jgi:4-hydroxybenzoate polyprenyltransferase